MAGPRARPSWRPDHDARLASSRIGATGCGGGGPARHGARGRVREFAQATKPSQQAADALGCDVAAIASCLVFMVDDEPVMVIKSGRHRVDLAVLAHAAQGTDARQATADEVRV